MVKDLIQGGIDAARFNFSHGNHEDHLTGLNMLKMVRDSVVALKEGLIQDSDTVVITAGVPLGRSVATNLIKAHVIDKRNAR